MIADEPLWLRRSGTARRVVVTIAIAVVILGPAYHELSGRVTAQGWFLIAGAIVMTLVFIWAINAIDVGGRPVPWPVIAVMLGLGIALLAVGGDRWLGPMVVASGVAGRFSTSPRPAVLTAAIGAVTGIAVAQAGHYSFGNVVAAVVVPPLVALLGYSAGARVVTLESLRRTRAELARAAAAEERLRIARDLHDLLGHSLSLITIKAELAGRLMTTDPDRAAREISELESVARQSLSDVREAVAGFRQPDLAGELVAARQLLDAAGIASDITSADTSGLARDVDSTLAWAVREGTTNVVRHSRATHVDIQVSRDPTSIVAEIRDNGPAAPEVAGGEPSLPAARTAGPDGRAAISRARPVFDGSGLAGLAERVRTLGGELAAGAVEPRGFQLRVVVPLRPQTAQ